jgi:hypothetical protein
MDANGLDKLKFGEGITKDDITITQEADGEAICIRTPC